MAREAVDSNLKGRLEDYISFAKSGKTVRLKTRLYKNWFKQVSQSNATDDIDTEVDKSMLMADFTPDEIQQGMPEKVTKAYMICPVNENEIDEKTTHHIANERLRMDYARLREAGIRFEEKFF